MGFDGSRRRRKLRVGAGALLASGLALFPGPVGAAAPYEIVADGLDNPRGIGLRYGLVYVAEAGRGGDQCVPGINPETGEPSTVCVGNTSGVTRIQKDGRVEDVISGYPSFAEEGGFAALGIIDVSTKRGLNFLTSGPTDAPAALQPLLEDFGKLFRYRGGQIFERADLSAFEEANDPDGEGVNSNPNGFFTTGEVRHLVADAGGNSLLHVDRRGRVSLVAVLPGGTADAPPFLGLPPGTQIPYQPVPTSVTRGPDGAYYVGQLTGFPFPVGDAKVFRVTRDGEVSVHAEGFTNIIDVTFDNDGNLFVLEIASAGLLNSEPPEGDPTGTLWKISEDGDRERISGPELVSPGGVAVSSDGDDAYVTNYSIFPGQGQVVHYDLDD